MAVTAMELSRRYFLKSGLRIGGTLLLGCGGGRGGAPSPTSSCPPEFPGGTFQGVVPFVDEGTLPLDIALGQGLDGRLLTDLSRYGPETPRVGNEAFYVRTRYPDLLVPPVPWTITVSGLVQTQRSLSLEDLLPLASPRGDHVLECSGNGPGGHFGLLSATNWEGIPFSAFLERALPIPTATRVLVDGFDQYSVASLTSQPGASWIFTFADLRDAFLATTMGGATLPKDHGAPVRLFVPNWYGCTSIKWVNRVALVDDSEPATAHMREYASRTDQTGIPLLARAYRPAQIQLAAMATRVERWVVGGRVQYRVVGIVWGGDRVGDALAIRFNPSEPFVPVQACPDRPSSSSWGFWSHAWTPTAPGHYAIQLDTADPSIPAARLRRGVYARSVVI